MKQSWRISLLKSVVNTAVGFVLALVTQWIAFPLVYGQASTHKQDFVMISIFTVVSVLRGLGMERVFEALGWRVKMSPFASAVIYERNEQNTREGYSTEHDDELRPGVLSEGAMDYAASWMCGDASTSRRSLVKAGALIIAEGDKFDRSRKSKRSNVTPLPSLAHKKSRREHAGSSG